MTIIFPIAGSASSAAFRPFLLVDGRTQLQAALDSFSNWRDHIERIVFICLQSHEARFEVSANLRKLVTGIEFELVSLPAPTSGPFESVSQACQLTEVSGPVIVCDCDHTLDLTPFFEQLHGRLDIECLIPIWPLRGEDLRFWSIAAVNELGRVTAIGEKAVPDVIGHFFGVIGCTYFKDLAPFVKRTQAGKFPYISDVIREKLRSGEVVEAVRLTSARFFGDSSVHREGRRAYVPPYGTILCDLDGTLIRHEDVANYDDGLALLPGTVAKLQAWKEAGFFVVITTSRPADQEKALVRALDQAGIRFDKLVMGLPSGPRYLINDRKPSAKFVKQAHAFELDRDKGIKDLEIRPEANFHTVRRFKGGSLAETLLLEHGGKSFIRKRVSKLANLASGYGKLRQQYRTIEQFSKLSRGLTPELYDEHDDSLEYYYDIEYLPHHKILSACGEIEQLASLDNLLDRLQRHIYSQRVDIAGEGAKWLAEHLATKIYSKLELIRAHPMLGRLVDGPDVTVNARATHTLLRSIRALTAPPHLQKFVPNFLSLIHGDLTFSNILINGSDIRLIDTDAGNRYDAAELDLGKLFQSLLGRYEDWEHRPDNLIEISTAGTIESALQAPARGDLGLTEMLARWSEILGAPESAILRKGKFYMALHFLRMVPYRLAISEQQGAFALLCAVKYLDQLVREEFYADA